MHNSLRRRGTGGRPGSRSGFILITTAGLVAFFTITGSSLLLQGLWRAGASHRAHDRSNALHLAEAAVDQAAYNLRTATAVDDLTAATLATGDFSIDPPQNLGNLRYRVTTQGASGSEQRELEVIFRLTQESIFQFALFGDTALNVSGNAITDSYDSSLGPYDNDPASPTYNAGHNGDVGTNASLPGGVAVSGSIFVDGQVAVGYDAPDPLSVIVGYDPLFITGGTNPPSDTQDVVAQTSAFPMPPVSVPPGLACADFTVGGNAVETLSPTGGQNGDGVYCYQNLTLQGGGTLTASGPVTVYLTGQFTARGDSLMGVPADPKQMMMLMTPTGDATIEQGTLTGSTRFYGALYAPHSTINITGTGDAEVFGSIVGQVVNVTGSAAIHYDESVTDLTQISNTFNVERIAWREL